MLVTLPGRQMAVARDVLCLSSDRHGHDGGGVRGAFAGSEHATVRVCRFATTMIVRSGARGLTIGDLRVADASALRHHAKQPQQIEPL